MFLTVFNFFLIECISRLLPPIALRAFRLGPYPKRCARSSPFRPHSLVADASVWGTFLLGVAFRHVICGFHLFFLPVRLPSEIPKLPSDPPVRGFPGVWKLPLLRFLSWDGSLSLALLSLFLSFIFCPTSF